MTTRSGPARDTEARWPPILTLILVIGLITALPSRYLVVARWFPWAIVEIGVAAMLAVTFAPASVLWRRVERVILTAIVAVACTLNVLTIVKLVGDMLGPKHGYGSITLLETATEIWIVNVLIFAVLYWQVDRPGPKAHLADFSFADENESEGPAGWGPRFVDYLFLAFAASTSFVPPEYSRPVSHRAKLMLMLQASISLVTIFLIAARAVSTLS